MSARFPAAAVAATTLDEMQAEIARFPSIAAAAAVLGIDRTSLSKRLSGGTTPGQWSIEEQARLAEVQIDRCGVSPIYDRTRAVAYHGAEAAHPLLALTRLRESIVGAGGYINTAAQAIADGVIDDRERAALLAELQQIVEQAQALQRDLGGRP